MKSTKMPAIILPAGGVYIKPVLDKNIMIAGCADDLGQPFLMSDPEPGTLYFQRAIEPVLNHYFPELKDFTLSLKWAGYYDYHWPDMTPVIESAANLTWAVSYTHLRAHETKANLVCRLLLEKKKKK